MESLNSALYFLLVGLPVLSVVVFIHELGHFLLAKWNGIGVLEFSVGFGRKIFRKKWGDTFYSLGLIPLGGYVRMIGDDPRQLHSEAALAMVGDEEENKSAEQAAGKLDESLFYGLPIDQIDQKFLNDRSKWFLNKGYWAKAAVVFAGPLFNLLSAVFIAALSLYIYGQQVPLDQPVIGSIQSGNPADKAGLHIKDKVLSIDGTEIKSWEDLARYISSSQEREMTLIVERLNDQGAAEKVKITLKGELEPKEMALLRGENEPQRVLIGVGPDIRAVREPVGLLDSVRLATIGVYRLSGMVLKSVFLMVKGHVAVKNIAGPVRIFGEAGKAAQRGLEDLAHFLVFLSVTLAVMNLLPIPVLDGGHLVFFTIEAIKGGPLNIRVQEFASQVGMFILLGLMVFALGNDILRLF